jgi:hypothetical protein
MRRKEWNGMVDVYESEGDGRDEEPALYPVILSSLGGWARTIQHLFISCFHVETVKFA